MSFDSVYRCSTFGLAYFSFFSDASLCFYTFLGDWGTSLLLLLFSSKLSITFYLPIFSLTPSISSLTSCISSLTPWISCCTFLISSLNYKIASLFGDEACMLESECLISGRLDSLMDYYRFWNNFISAGWFCYRFVFSLNDAFYFCYDVFALALSSCLERMLNSCFISSIMISLCLLLTDVFLLNLESRRNNTSSLSLYESFSSYFIVYFFSFKDTSFFLPSTWLFYSLISSLFSYYNLCYG